MSLYTAPNLTSGMDDTLIEVMTAVPAFGIGLLLFVFGLVFISGSTSQRRRTGYSDMPMWSLVASFATLLVSLVLSMKSGMIHISTLSIVIGITLLSSFWFFTSKGRGEI